MLSFIMANLPTATDLLDPLRRREAADAARLPAVSENAESSAKTYEQGYLAGLMYRHGEIERLRSEFDHALRISEQTVQVMQEDQQKHTADIKNSYQSGYLDCLRRSQAEIERLRGEIDHMNRVIEQTARVMQEDMEQFEARANEIDRMMRS